MKILRIGNNPFLSIYNSQKLTSIISVKRNDFDAVGVQMKNNKAKLWAQENKVLLTGKPLFFFNGELQYALQAEKTAKGQLFHLTTKKSYASVQIINGQPIVFGSWLDKSPSNIYSRIKNILGQLPIKLPNFNVQLIDKPIHLRLQPFERRMTQLVFKKCRKRGITRTFKADLDIQKAKIQLSQEFKTLIGQKFLLNMENTGFGFSQLVSRGLCSDKEVQQEQLCIGPFMEWSEQTELKRLL